MATLGEAFLLSAYSSEASTSRKRQSIPTFRVAVTALVSHEEQHKDGLKKDKQAERARSSKSIAVNTVQHNGVHLLDVS